ncbi:disease resistance protein RPP2B-like [Juglans regia]|uniref:Disease resistance protein RPP2B-like n=1 Tax=Juglans regia TaxID=51240 RepID=A0A6P9EVS2_JUGRE|nr:disease resistance protein RPP2B-like [Juglans regia]
MGKEIVREESPGEPGRRSRLWFHEDVRYVLEENTGTEQIEGILINLPQGDRTIRLSPKVFGKMKKLRIFINHNAGFCGKLNYLSNELRVLHWPKCPLLSLPSNFHGEKLVVLRIERSMIREMGVTLQSKNLTSLDLSYCEYLTKISDLSSCSNLEKLILHDCRSLVEVHDSVGLLDKLVQLDFTYCSRLKKLPRSFKLRSLELLEISDCTSLENFPEIECEMEHLKSLWLESVVIQELPSSITYLIGLQKLFMYGCESLVRLPINIFQLECLESVDIRCCPNFVNFGNEVGHSGQSMPGTQGNEISSSMELLPLSPPESNNLFNFSSSLRKLSLSGSGIVSLPPYIEGFVGLCELDLVDCKQLEEILHLPPNIQVLKAQGCGLLNRFPHVSTKSSFGTPDLKLLRWIDLSECNKVDVDVVNHEPNPLLVQVDISYISISINGKLIRKDEMWQVSPSMNPHHVCLQYIAAHSIDQKVSRSYKEGNNMRFTFRSDSEYDEAILKSAGVHLIYIQE